MVNTLFIAPSILAANHGQLAQEVQAVDRAGADWIHVDVMDGHFVPNLTLGPPIIASIRKASQLYFDVHLMIKRPQDSIAQYINAGANGITVHTEACDHLHRTLVEIRNTGVQAGVAINPATSIVAVEHVLHLVDTVLVMTVNPGFGGQSFIQETLPKIRSLRRLANDHQLSPRIEVDGGIDAMSIGEAAKAGADTFVAGSAIYGQNDYTEVIAKLRALAHAHVN